MDLSDVTQAKTNIITTCCLKLEDLLKEILAKFVADRNSPDLMLRYLCRYGYDGSHGNLFTELRAEEYSKCLTTRSSMTLAQLIYEVFENTKHGAGEKQGCKLGTAASSILVDAYEKGMFIVFNDMHVNLLRHREDDIKLDLEVIYSVYEHIIMDSQTFQQAYPSNTAMVSCDATFQEMLTV